MTLAVNKNLGCQSDLLLIIFTAQNLQGPTYISTHRSSL